MAAVARRTQSNGTSRDETPNEQNNPHELDDLEASLLQTVIAKRVLLLDDALNILGNLAEVTDSNVRVDQDSLEEIMSRINMVISDLDFEIRKTLDQATGNPLWAMVNTTSDSFSQLATIHSVNEISYMRGLLEAIFDTSNSLHEEIFAIRSTDASNLCSRHYLTKTAGELAVQTFIREGWLEKSPNGFITLSERGLLELKGYLMQTYNDLDEGEDEEGGEGGRVDKMRTCHACQEIITKGQRCATLRCLVRFHDHCAANFFTPRNNSCPSCKTAWKEHLPVGEAACSDRSRRRISNRQQDSESESPEIRRNSSRASPTSRRSSAASGRSRSPPARRNGTSSRGSRWGSSRRTSAAQSIQEEEEEDDDEDSN